jgi:hypothetical protein
MKTKTAGYCGRQVQKVRLASIAAGVIDPVTVASMFIPGAQGTLAARIGSQVAIGAAGTALSEVALNNQQYTRTAESAHITAGAMFSGIFACWRNVIPGVRTQPHGNG